MINPIRIVIAWLGWIGFEGLEARAVAYGRLRICGGCEENTGGVLSLCRLCNCPVAGKVHDMRGYCPLYKWKSYKVWNSPSA